MPSIYQSSTIVCLPSYREGFPKALLEASSCAKPIVAFDVPGCREVVFNELNGMLVPFGNTRLLRENISRLIQDAKKCETLGRNGRRIVEERFSASRINAKTFDVWKELLRLIT